MSTKAVSGPSVASPRPFSDFPGEANAARRYLELLVLIDHLAGNNAFSLGDIERRLRAFLENESREQGRPIECPRYNTIRCGLPNGLRDLLYLSFGRPVKLFRMDRRRITGLTEEGRAAAQLAMEYLTSTGGADA